MATRAAKSLGHQGSLDHDALSALGNLIELVPGPTAQASTFRAFGAAKLGFHTGSTASGSVAESSVVSLNFLYNGRAFSGPFSLVRTQYLRKGISETLH